MKYVNKMVLVSQDQYQQLLRNKGTQHVDKSTQVNKEPQVNKDSHKIPRPPGKPKKIEVNNVLKKITPPLGKPKKNSSPVKRKKEHWLAHWKKL